MLHSDTWSYIKRPDIQYNNEWASFPGVTGGPIPLDLAEFVNRTPRSANFKLQPGPPVFKTDRCL